MAERRRRRVVALVGLVLAGLLSACGGGASAGGPVSGTPDDGLSGTAIEGLYRLPDTELTATDGTSYDLRTDTTAPLTLVFFGYTRCPDICQVVMATLASAMTRLPAADRAKVDVLFVTTDPARDDPGTLRTYLDRLDPTFEGLTGPLPRILAAGKAMGVPIAQGQRLSSGGYEVDHGTQVYGVDSRGVSEVVWTAGGSPEDIARDVVALLRAGPAGAGS